MPKKIQRRRMVRGVMLAAMFHALPGLGTEARAADVVLAQARADFSSVTPANGNTTATWGGGLGIPDTYGRTMSTTGCGYWNYLQSDNANPTSGTPALLSWQSIGNAGNSGYGGTANFAGFMLPSIGASRIFNDGVAPAADQVTWHPYLGGQPYAVLRWTAGAAESGLIKIEGAIDKTGEPGDGNDSFAVFVNGVSQFSVPELRNGDSRAFSFSLTVSAGQNVDFVLGGISFGANEAKLSATISGPAPMQGPAAPTGLGATAGNNTVLLGWTASSGATGYNVKRSTTQGTGYVTIGTASSPPHLDNTVTNGTPYYYVVSATNTAGEGDNSAEVSATPAPVLLDQTITFALGLTVTKTTLDAAFADTATASSTLAVTYSSDNPSVATVDASGMVTITGLGTAHILADQAGDAGFNPAPQVSQTLNVVPRIQNMHDYTFNDNTTPAGFTVVGSPTYSGGQLVLDGSACLTMATPVTAPDNFAIEVICTPTVNDDFNFSAVLNNGANNGWGLLQVSGTYLGIAEGASFLSSAGPATLGTPVRLALVRAGGLTTVYENGVAVGPPYSGSRATPTTLTIGASQNNATTYEGFFKGSIDEVRVFTFFPGTFNPATDLLTGPTTGGGNAYASWAHDHAGDGAPSDDYNHDGVANGVAYFMGATGLATNPGVVGGTVTWPYLNAVTSFEAQVSNDLVIWENATTGVDTALPPGGHVTYTLPTGPGITKKFCRLMVVP
jgi:hypothetical protein